jgi:hypothetical protein
MVLVAPVLLLAVTAVFQAMLYFHALQVARLAANESLMSTQGQSGSVSAGQHRADDVLAQFDNPLGVAAVDVTRDAQTAKVRITGKVPMLLPGFQVAVQATASGPVSAFHP